MSIYRILQTWDDFWFKKTSPLPVAVFRILLGLTLLQYAILLAPNLLIWFGEHGIISSTTATALSLYPCINLLGLLSHNDHTVNYFFYLFVLAVLGLTIGLCTRTSTIIAYACLVSFHVRNPTIINSGDLLMGIFLFYLIFSPAGDALSFDSLFGNRRTDSFEYKKPKLSWPWAQRLIQIQIAAVYFQAFWSKMAGAPWLDGTALYWVLREKEFLRFPVPFIADHLWLCVAITWGTLIIEFTMWTLIWIKEFRLYIVAAAILLHLGIDYAMNLPMFETLMIFSFVVFLTPEDISKGWTQMSSKFVIKPIPEVIT